ncbi:Aldehyde/histidinol dehydrogenase [Geopyxis carbonaria]|nr:Aldehyde/histidinol dehydrogenase [Geopyxis carbonaria]
MLPYNSASDVADIYTTLTTTFASGLTRDVAWRRLQLKQCWWMLIDNVDKITAACEADLTRTPYETQCFEMMPLKEELHHILANLDSWVTDGKLGDINAAWRMFWGTTVRKDPIGTVLIIGAWNYPFHLLLRPFFAALAAGCCVVLKPSEMSSASAHLIAELVPKYLDPSAVRVVCGGPIETQHLLAAHRFDKIFYTGSTRVARLVAKAAAEHLTPTACECGGQNPAIVGKSADIELAAKSVAYTKFTNAGQICLAVNHVIVDPTVHDKFVEAVGRWMTVFTSGGEMACLANDRAFVRLSTLLSTTNGIITYGGNHNSADRSMSPTIVTNVQPDDPLLAEELFGPILPVICRPVNEACILTTLRPHAHPLALYVFSSDTTETDYILANTRSGGVTLNGVYNHALAPGAPLGGVGMSGYGYYHGRSGFMEFSVQRPVTKLSRRVLPLMWHIYPPFTKKEAGLKTLRRNDNVSFKRGEGIEDQRKKWSFGVSSMIVAVGVVVVATILVALGFSGVFGS